jgi:hypothetical protein
MADENGKTVPDAVEDFAVLLKEYGVKEGKAKTIAKYIADTGQPDIFDDPEALLEKMIKWPRELNPLARVTILEHWGAQRGFNLSSSWDVGAVIHGFRPRRTDASYP